jgi:hypothetical protein
LSFASDSALVSFRGASSCVIVVAPPLARHLHRQDLGLELPGLRRRHRLPVAVERERVLLLAAHPGLLAGVLGVLAHVAAAERVPEPVVDHAVEHRLMAGLDPLPHPEDVMRRGRHRFLPARDDALGVARLDRLGGEHHGLETGAADLVDGERGNGGGDAGVDHRLARGGLTRAALHHLAHDDFLDQARVDAGAAHRLADDHRAELRSAE